MPPEKLYANQETGGPRTRIARKQGAEESRGDGMISARTAERYGSDVWGSFRTADVPDASEGALLCAVSKRCVPEEMARPQMSSCFELD